MDTQRRDKQRDIWSYTETLTAAHVDAKERGLRGLKASFCAHASNYEQESAGKVFISCLRSYFNCRGASVYAFGYDILSIFKVVSCRGFFVLDY